MNIYQSIRGETADYAASELAKYLERITGIRCEISEGRGEDGITLALLGDLGLPCGDVSDAVIDDVIDIDISGHKGYIAGSNARSVLLGVYKYLKTIGCRFIRPGDDGEVIPRKDISEHQCKLHLKGYYPFRAECLEGAVSYETVKNTLYWLPKVGYNAFMIQGVVPYNFMDRWFSHNESTVKKSSPITYEEAAEYTAKIEADIRKIGLQFHDVGHAYTFEPFGYHYLTSWRHKYEVDDYTKSFMALVNGKRDIMHDSINFTNLCYSNPEARKKIVNFFVDYMKKKPYVDFIHIWLADNTNNQCECEECMKSTISDIYVSLLNDIDKAFEENGITAKIVFCVYIDTRWAPLKERFNNSDRFILLNAVSRSYTKGYTTEKYPHELPKIERNNFIPLPEFEGNMSFLDKWRQMFPGPVIFFEYHLYSDHYCDPGYIKVSETLCHDIKMLDKLGVNGLMNCKSQRLYLPTSLPAYAAGEMLFDNSKSYDEIADEYFEGAFGKDGDRAYEYLRQVTKLFSPDLLRTKISVEEGEAKTADSKKVPAWHNNPEAAKNFASVKPLIESFLPIIKENMEKSADKCKRRSWELLKYHADMILLFAQGLYEGAMGNHDRSREICMQLIDYVSLVEDEILQEFDLCLFAKRMKIIFDIKWHY